MKKFLLSSYDPAKKIRLSQRNPYLVSMLATLVLSACVSTPTTTSQQPSITQPQPHIQVAPAHSNDIWQHVRDNFRMPELYNDEVLSKEGYYASRADYVGRMTERSGDFLYVIMGEIERRRMPSELALLPFVESAFVTTARSSAKAQGLWQFMPATGRDFSLSQNRFVDQRNDVIASTNAALDYLQQLHDQFGDWHLALAAYNWGQGNVSRAVSRSYANGGSGSYMDITMPAETRQYVPKLQAIKNIVRNPELYGITLPRISNKRRYDVVAVTRDMDVSKAAQLSGMSEEEFKRINPAFKKPVIVGALSARILVPSSQADAMRDALASSQDLATLTTYTTYSSEALSDIAAKYNTDEYRLRELNNIPYGHNYVQADSTLIVPRTRKNDEIPYQALNSTVRSISGGAGFVEPYNPNNQNSDPNYNPNLALSNPNLPRFSIEPDGSVSNSSDNNNAYIPQRNDVPALVTNTPRNDKLTALINTPPPIYDAPNTTPTDPNAYRVNPTAGLDPNNRIDVLPDNKADKVANSETALIQEINPNPPLSTPAWEPPKAINPAIEPATAFAYTQPPSAPETTVAAQKDTRIDPAPQLSTNFNNAPEVVYEPPAPRTELPKITELENSAKTDKPIVQFSPDLFANTPRTDAPEPTRPIVAPAPRQSIASVAQNSVKAAVVKTSTKARHSHPAPAAPVTPTALSKKVTVKEPAITQKNDKKATKASSATALNREDKKDKKAEPNKSSSKTFVKPVTPNNVKTAVKPEKASSKNSDKITAAKKTTKETKTIEKKPIEKPTNKTDAKKTNSDKVSPNKPNPSKTVTHPQKPKKK